MYIHQILPFVSINYPQLLTKVMQNFLWIIQPCKFNKRYHQCMVFRWVKGHLSAKSVKIVAKFYLSTHVAQILKGNYLDHVNFVMKYLNLSQVMPRPAYMLVYMSPITRKLVIRVTHKLVCSASVTSKSHEDNIKHN